MTEDEKRLEITELDFHKIKENFKSFLKSQDEFSDYNLDASGLDVIQDLLAYNTMYNAFLVNMQTMENSLITANRRSSVARESYPLGYIPRSARGAEAVVNLSITIPNEIIDDEFDGLINSIRYEKNNKFQTSINGQSMVFVNPKEKILNYLKRDSENSYFEINNLLIKQGRPKTFRYTVDRDDDFQRFIIPHEDVDIDTLRVFSRKPGETSSRSYRQNIEYNIDEIDDETRTYFLRENSEGKYEIIFGDGQYGYNLVDGERITLEYTITNGPDANGAKSFTVSNDISLSGKSIEEADVEITKSTRASGGADRESVQSIKNNAPLSIQAQNRAVAPRDFRSIIKNHFSQVESVTVWGGEENDPPRYGTVMMSVKPYGSLYVTENEKDQIRETLKEKMFNVIRIGFLEPEYIFIGLNIRVLFNSQNTLKTSEDIRREVINTIRDYSKNVLEQFDSQFFTSRLTTEINGMDDSIVSNDVQWDMIRKFTPEFDFLTDYNFEFLNPIYYPNDKFVGSIESSEFDIPGHNDCRIVQSEERNETLKVVTREDGKTIDVDSDAGAVDYESGSISLSPLIINGIDGNKMQIRARPEFWDVAVRRNYIMIIEESDISLSIIDTSRSDQLGREIIEPDPEKLKERLEERELNEDEEDSEDN